MPMTVKEVIKNIIETTSYRPDKASSVRDNAQDLIAKQLQTYLGDEYQVYTEEGTAFTKTRSIVVTKTGYDGIRVRFFIVIEIEESNGLYKVTSVEFIDHNRYYEKSFVRIFNYLKKKEEKRIKDLEALEA